MEFFGLCKGIKNMKLPNTKELNIYEGFFSHFYNECVTEKFDCELYLALAQAYGNNILELGCGNGRVVVPLLEKGLKVTGVDLSNDMLNILNEKTAYMKNRPVIICEDMCKFVSGEKYDVVILAHTTLCLLRSLDERELLFKNVYRNLREGGVFVFNYVDAESIKSEEKLPEYFFNRQKKSFIILMEKIFKERSISVVNLYAEEMTDDGTVNRYITSTTKSLLNRNIVADVINRTSFLKLKEYVLDIGADKLVFEVIKKA